MAWRVPRYTCSIACIITSKLSDFSSSTAGVGALDRTLGFLFGAARVLPCSRLGCRLRRRSPGS